MTREYIVETVGEDSKDVFRFLGELVRCKDCEKAHLEFSPHGDPAFVCNRALPIRFWVDSSDYCSKGVRK